MISLIFSSLPMFACGFWAILIGCTLYFDGRNRGYLMLFLFMVMATLLYAGHCAFLNHFYSDMPVLDSLYSFANLAVYPLFYIYIVSMTSPESQLRHNLKISDVAAELCTNRLYVSTAINEEVGISFSDYINRKRVNYAIHLMRVNPQLTIYEIADLSGFSSDKSFYRNFKNITGKSPKEIR